MEHQTSTKPSPGLLKTCSTIGVIGIIVHLIPLLISGVPDIPDDSEEALSFVSCIGWTLFAACLITMLIYTAGKIKNNGKTKPSPIAMFTLAGLLGISVIADFCTLNDTESSIDEILSILVLLMMIVVGVLYLLQSSTKKIGIWIIGSVVGIILAAYMAINIGAANKLMLFIILIVAVAPAATMFDNFKKFLTGPESAE